MTSRLLRVNRHPALVWAVLAVAFDGWPSVVLGTLAVTNLVGGALWDAVESAPRRQDREAR